MKYTNTIPSMFNLVILFIVTSSLQMIIESGPSVPLKDSSDTAVKFSEPLKLWLPGRNINVDPVLKYLLLSWIY